MFNFFKKKVNKKIPKEYLHLINQQQYANIVDLAIQYFKEKGDEVISLKNGFLCCKNEDGEEMKYGFDNLVRILAAQPKEEWESLLYTHFNTMNVSDNHWVYYRKDYEAAKPFLKVLIKDEEILQHEFAQNIIYRIDLPETVTVLVMDYENQFRFLQKDDIGEWEKTTEQIFEDALENIAEEDIKINAVEHEDEIKVFLFFSGDFSAAAMIEFEKNAHFALGKFGSIIAIPTKGTAFVSPIDDENVYGRIEVLTEPVSKFFSEDPGNITTNLYWYYNGKFQKFPETPSEKQGYISINIPIDLQQLLNKQHG